MTSSGTTASVDFEVVNNVGTTLPSTGGIGTKLFYIIGGMLVAGSVILLVTKKRMNIKED
ncbi:LPXTG cell wall anchor domain-containing protein [Ruminococcus sp.]